MLPAPASFAAMNTGITVSTITTNTTTLTSGSCWPLRIAPKIQIGSVLCAPAVKFVTTISSNDSANARSAPDTTAVDSSGNVTHRNVCRPWAPRSIDASISEPEVRRSRAITLL